MKGNDRLSRIEALVESITEQMKETDRRMKETDKLVKETSAQMKETDKRMKETDKRVAKVTDAMGYFVEYTAAPSLPKVFKPRGIRIQNLFQEASAQRNGQFMEIDVVCVGKRRDKRKVVILTELKSQVKAEAVKALEEKIEQFPKFFSQYKGLPRIGVIGGIKVPQEVALYAERHGFYVLVPSGETMRFANKKGFKPKVW